MKTERSSVILVFRNMSTQNIQFGMKSSLKVPDGAFSEERIQSCTSNFVYVVLCSVQCCVWIPKPLFKTRGLVCSAVCGEEVIIVVGVSDVNFLWTNADDWTWKIRTAQTNSETLLTVFVMKS